MMRSLHPGNRTFDQAEGQAGPLRRADPRTEAQAAGIRGIVTGQSRPQGPFFVWDLSDRGMRILVTAPARTGEILRLTIGRPFVMVMSVEVRWCKAVPDGSGFHLGVKSLDSFARLEALHRLAARLSDG